MNNNPKVLLVLEDLHVGGGQSYLVQLASYLRSSGRYLVYVAHGEGDFWRPRIAELDIPLFRFNIKRGLSLLHQYKNWSLFLKFWRLIRQYKIDLVHFDSMAAPIWAALAAYTLRVPTIYTPMSVRACGLAQIRLNYRTHPYWARLLDRWITHYVALSEYIRSEYVNWRGIAEIKVSLNWLGVDMDRFTPGRSGILRARFGLAEDQFLALYVARLDPWKKIDIVIRGIAHAKALGCEVTLAIAGCGPLLRELQLLSESLGCKNNVIFLGAVNSDLIPDLYRCADVYVASGTNPNLGLATLEAMASGLPLIQYGDTDEKVVMIRDTCVDGVNGYIARSIEEMANRLCELKSNRALLASMGQASRRIAEERFDLRKHLKRVDHLYQYLLNARRL